MRLWTVHPQYPDAKGLVALWREALLAQKVLQGGTRGYRHHPQLRRFLATARRDPARLRACRSVVMPEQHPLFRIVPGGVREWENVPDGQPDPT